MSTFAIELTTDPAVSSATHHGLTSTPKTLPPWLFYDEAGSRLFEQITALPEYYLTRTERAIFTTHATDIFHAVRSSTNNQQPTTSNLSIVELGAGTATKTGILLHALTRLQPRVLYQPIDISPTALDEAHTLASAIPNLTVLPQVANYITHPIHIHREPHHKVLALYIGSSIGNFSPAEARAILANLRAQLLPGDALLLGTDLAPSPSESGPSKSIATLLAAYDDAAGVTAAFNRNILTRLNRDLAADFDLTRFTHAARWNPTHSRIEMHLVSTHFQMVRIPASTSQASDLTLHFAPGETIHTENSYKFTPASIAALLADSSFTPTRTFTDPANLFAVTLATAV
jgi:L-histidine Nalpha-methyltransferase